MKLRNATTCFFLIIGTLSAAAVIGSQRTEPSTETGVLLSYSGGLTGSSTGEIRLRVKDREIRVFYQNPFKRYAFAGPNCERIGAIWKIQYRRRVVDPDTGIDLYLESATCTGQVDASIGPASDAVLEFLQSVARRDFVSAHRLLDPVLASKQRLSSLESAMLVYDFSQFQNFGSVIPCTEVRQTVRQGVNVLAGPQCFITKEGRPTSWSFHVIARKGVWRIASFIQK